VTNDFRARTFLQKWRFPISVPIPRVNESDGDRKVCITNARMFVEYTTRKRVVVLSKSWSRRKNRRPHTHSAPAVLNNRDRYRIATPLHQCTYCARRLVGVNLQQQTEYGSAKPHRTPVQFKDDVVDAAATELFTQQRDAAAMRRQFQRTRDADLVTNCVHTQYSTHSFQTGQHRTHTTMATCHYAIQLVL